MTEIEKVKQETYDYLFLQLGYDHETAKKTVDSFDRVTKYLNGKPSIVVTKDGAKVYLQ